MATVDSIITSVQQTQPQHVLNPELLTTVHLDLRGRRFHVDRDTLMNLPESVLLCLFPNGLVLSRVGGGSGSQWSDGADNEEDEYLYVVDVSWPQIQLHQAISCAISSHICIVNLTSYLL